MKSILDRSFRYTPSGQTDLKKTFARVRRELNSQAKANAGADAKVNVLPLKQRNRLAGE